MLEGEAGERRRNTIGCLKGNGCVDILQVRDVHLLWCRVIHRIARVRTASVCVHSHSHSIALAPQLRWQVYDDLLKREEGKLEEIPAYWYKNFGLIASNLYQMSSEVRWFECEMEQAIGSSLVSFCFRGGKGREHARDCKLLRTACTYGRYVARHTLLFHTRALCNTVWCVFIPVPPLPHIQEKYKQKKIEQWLKYIRSGANDSQINDMISILRADGADI